ncbi:type II toxin-antitoxin system Phd/YefM family antitoxin [Nocardia sp. alder85J]|uniref:type II toxin-antitoxin system Phd/YefM family antitoxin n=1 Tax=Nocardia sp. alder85J TaxID=2862949 RepID=UPI001CD4E248|nr:type II toxin-antitoxin system prevent-host-death family antitoxin [Nocardia sp. alder85J]MCX4095179.1 type II toxin-antitoxin system prevent-host-death family antitoxin [Nocardia sp. alder85J]
MAKTISVREFRNESAAVLNEVESGESFVLTRNGTPIAEVRPLRVKRKPTTEELQRIFALSPAPDYRALRSELDQYFGEDRLDDE